ncbi:MAG: HesA/MoeB/ThiF family protein [Muribaculaceae bacterium]|nr:HesA/MoeB/ThiF family protein [Muribaculaceae bacterium]MDE7081719.1 HesA/MoeB/ThiF family protein [Muribaculaceae bacterium]
MTKNRYSRNIACIGTEGQRRLSDASVFIIGCGALGGQVAMLLAGAGTGHIGIADFDTIDISNLQRQLFFAEAQAGQPKTAVIGERMRQLNSTIRVDVYERMIRPADGPAILSEYDFIIDATDNPATKYMTDRICRQIGRPGCIGGVAGWQGQVVSVTGRTDDGSLGFADIFPQPDADPSMLPCEVTGVMGAAASVIASVQASEAMKYFIGEGRRAVNGVVSINLLTLEMHHFEFTPSAAGTPSPDPRESQ